MIEPSFFIILTAVLIVLFVVINTIVKKKKQEKLLQEQRQANKQKQEELINKFCNNPKIRQWAMEITTVMDCAIKDNPLREYEFHLRAYRQDLIFGFYLRTLRYKNLDLYNDEPHRQILLAYHFADYQLPELKLSELLFLEIAVSEIVKKLFLEKQITIEYRKTALFINGLTGNRAEDTDDDNLIALRYVPPKATDTW